jgi:VCBS repeat-containing protein
MQARADHGNATTGENIASVTGGSGSDSVTGHFYAWSYDYYYSDSENHTALLSDNHITADLGAGSDYLDFYFYAYDYYDYYYGDNLGDTVTVTGNGLTVQGGMGSDNLHVSFYAYNYDGDGEVNLSGNTVSLDGGGDSDTLYAYLDQITDDNQVTLAGGDSNDFIHSYDYGSNTRLFIGGAGNDTIIDHYGQSTAQFSGAKSDYSITINLNGTVTVADLRDGSPDGTDTLTGVDVLRFSNGDFLPDGTRISGNAAPVGTNDSYAVDEDVTLVVTASGVLVNDSDDDGDTLTAVLVAGPTNGSLTLNSDGSFEYSPNANYHGADSFTYRANDGEEAGNLVTVNITVIR